MGRSRLCVKRVVLGLGGLSRLSWARGMCIVELQC